MPTNSDRLALATIVTASVLDEFEVLKLSFELFHGLSFQWFVRCDQAAEAQLSEHENVHCSRFDNPPKGRPDAHTEESKVLMGQKMSAVNQAWSFKDWEAIVYVDADLIVTSEFVGTMLQTPGDVLIAPHFEDEHMRPGFNKYGPYNAGFVFLRSRSFLKWWEEAYRSQPWLFSDQQALRDAHKFFQVTELDRNANVGSWRRTKDPFIFHSIPKDCLFLHVHLFQPLITPDQLANEVFKFELASLFSPQPFSPTFDAALSLQKAFSLHCLQFLLSSGNRNHQVICQEIVNRDRLGLYASFLNVAAPSKAVQSRTAIHATSPS